MRRRVIGIISLSILSLTMLLLAILLGSSLHPQLAGFETPGAAVKPPRAIQVSMTSPLSNQCALQPVAKRPGTKTPYIRVDANQVTLSRFRQLSPDPPEILSETARSYTPREVIALADPSNFGDRYFLDASGQPALLDPIVVLHETVGSAASALNLFRTYHPYDDDQVSYHTLICRDGTVFYVVPPDKRAYGAGNSVFSGSRGIEAVRTNPQMPPSVNNFAYHISLETPADGNNNRSAHSGYTFEQYQSLAWLVAKTGVPDDRITTHRQVDRSRSRMDPRSFDTAWFISLLNTFPRTNEIDLRCLPPAGGVS